MLDGESNIEVKDCIINTQTLVGESKVEESIVVTMNRNENKLLDGIDDVQMIYGESKVE
jgi:hypothetical protein